MKVISHRGNLDGRVIETENTPYQIERVHDLGYDVEIDVWYFNDKWYLGHDTPDYEVSEKWLKKRKKYLWCHAKNLEAMQMLLKINMHCFWHEKDKMTLTSKGIPWCYPGIYVKDGITVIFDKSIKISQTKIKGICTDYPLLMDDLISD